MESITNPQIQKLHCLYRELNIRNKEEMLLTFTNGRTNSTGQLSKDEGRQLISFLMGEEPLERQRKLIFSLAYRAGIIYGETKLDKTLNRVKLNLFLMERGAVKKELNKMSLEELKKVHRQMEAVIRHNAANSDNKTAKAATDKLLTELNIAVSTK